jgi:predicted ATP-dependent protease
MDAKGHVGAIGGVTEKIEGAKKVHASLIFVPRDNCSDLPASVKGISVLAVDSVDQAMAYLLAKSQRNVQLERDLNSEGIHGCANLGA